MLEMLVLDSVSEICKVTEDELTSGNISRQFSEARRMAVAVFALCGYTREEIAEILNFASGSGVTKSIRQHEEALASTDTQYIKYCWKYVQVIMAINKQIKAKRRFLKGIKLLPLPNLSHKPFPPDMDNEIRGT